MGLKNNLALMTLLLSNLFYIQPVILLKNIIVLQIMIDSTII